MSKRRAIEAARRVLAKSGPLKAPVDPVEVAERVGLEVVERSKLELHGREVSGLLLRRKGRTIAIVNRDHHPRRRRFTLAHEIGHFLLHPVREAYVDDVGGALARDDRSAEGTDLREIEANAFAAELLMPEGLIREEVPSRFGLFFEEDRLTQLSDQFGVSKQAMTFRLTNLGLLSL